MRVSRFFGATAFALAGACSGGLGAQGQTDSAVIHLHLPGQTIHLHPLRQHTHKQGTPAHADEIGVAPAAPEKPTGAQPAEPVATEPTTTAPATTEHKGGASNHPAIPFNFGDEDAAAPEGAAGQETAPPMHTAALPPHPETSTPSAASAAARNGLTKHGAVLFSKGAADPSPTQFNGVKVLAGDLEEALESGGARVELDAYGGAPGDRSSDARRLSLRRALAVRQLLIDDGLPSSRIDVRALGGAEDKGPSDRVDVFVRAG